MQQTNNLRKIRQAMLLGKTELARLSGLSLLTIDRIEKGMNCRMETQRKILLALGIKFNQKHKVFKTFR
ncbi:MAG: XRE family transcriptional regulator [Deltaproteobacteria bacterium]|nr:XRE family transcriptional regulator [Deltaproteobacteria bacterium]